MKNQRGFAFFEVLIVIVGIGLVGAVGYMAYTNFIAHKSSDTASVRSSDVTKPVTVKTKADLETASAALDAVQLDDSDSTQLDSSANSF